MKRIVILGAGESGAGAAVLAKKEGFDVFVSDSAFGVLPAIIGAICQEGIDLISILWALRAHKQVK